MIIRAITCPCGVVFQSPHGVAKYHTPQCKVEANRAGKRAWATENRPKISGRGADGGGSNAGERKGWDLSGFRESKPHVSDAPPLLSLSPECRCYGSHGANCGARDAGWR